MRVRLPKSDADASVSRRVSSETLEALDSMMLAVTEMFILQVAEEALEALSAEQAPQAKPCGYVTCHHSRRKCG